MLVDKYLKKAGGFGCMQLLVVITCMCCFSSVNFFFAQMSYMELYPKYTCTYSNQTEPMHCKPEDFCHNANVTSYVIDWDADESLHNWVEKLNLTCVSKEKIGWLGSSFFVGWIATLFVLPRLADLYGRKWIWRLGMIVQLASYTVIMLTHNVNVMIAAIGVIGACNTARVNVGFIVMLEFLPEEKHALVGSSVWITESFVNIVGVLYFTFMSKNWYWFVLVGYIW